MRDRKLIIMIILLMAVGFAVVSANLIMNGGIKIGTNVDGFDVYFSEALLDGEESNKITLSGNRKTITYETKDLTKVDDTSELSYKVKNNSNIYDAKVRINCHTEENEYVSVTANFNGKSTPAEDEIRAGEELPGVITARLKKAYAGDNTLEVEIKCEIEARAIEEETTRTPVNTNTPGVTYNEEVIIAHDIYYKEEEKYSNGLNERYKLYCTEYTDSEESGVILCSKTNKEGSCKKVKNKTCDYADVAGIFDKVKFTNQTKRYNFADAGNGNWHIQTYCNTAGEETDYNGGLYYCDSKKELHDWYQIEDDSSCDENIGKVWNFEYTEATRQSTFIPSCTGKYKLEVWGAQGGDGIGLGGYGGYSVGEININDGKILYVNVGEKGVNISGGYGGRGGWNGGGDGGNGVGYSSSYPGGAGGGGATHIATIPGELSTLSDFKGTYSNEEETYISNDIIIVAGGGGGSSSYLTYAASALGAGGGGGYIGGKAETMGNQRINGGSQTSGYQFGKGQSGRNGTSSGSSAYEGAGGAGGGWYGGYAQTTYGAYTDVAGTGGSGYIGSSKLTNKIMYMHCDPDYSIFHFVKDCDLYKNNKNLLKTNTTIEYSSSAESFKAKEGNGAARITYLG